MDDEVRTPELRDPFLVPVLEKLSMADRDKLVALMGGWPIVPSDD